MAVSPERILIVKLGAIGDVVNALPCVNRLRRGLPGARISWAIGPLAHRLVAGHPAVDEFLELDLARPGSWAHAVRRLRAGRFDLALDLQRLLKSGLLAWSSGAPLRVGFDRARCKEGSHLFTNLRLAPNPRPGTTVAQYLEFADLLGIPPCEPEWRLPYEPWTGDGEPGGPRVTLNLGASKPANRWYADRWARLAEGLVREEGARVRLSGGPEDRPLAAEVARLCAAPLRDCVGELTLPQSAGLLAASDLVIACDTGPLHVAVALGVPVVALFGAADPARTGPFGRPGSVVSVPTICAPCRRRTCFVAGHPCMTELAPELVLERARAALRRPAPTTEWP